MTSKPDLQARYLEMQKRDAEERAKTRANLLVKLRALGVTLIEIQYEGYGDAGNVEDVTPTPTTIKLAYDLNLRVEAFGWDFAYALNPGFENNQGGYGALEWKLEADKINVSHRNRYDESDTIDYEDL